MPKYHVTGTYAFSYTETVIGNGEMTLDDIVEAENEATAIEAAIDAKLDVEDYEITSDDALDWCVDSDDRSGVFATNTEIDESDPEYQRRHNEATMRALGPQIAPPLLELE